LSIISSSARTCLSRVRVTFLVVNWLFAIVILGHFFRTGGWNPVGESPADQPLSFKCEGLINKKEYKFRVLAVNKMGNSEPGLFPKVVLAKDPWGKVQEWIWIFTLFAFGILNNRWTRETRQCWSRRLGCWSRRYYMDQAWKWRRFSDHWLCHWI
jgi:hypothetical protein